MPASTSTFEGTFEDETDTSSEEGSVEEEDTTSGEEDEDESVDESESESESEEESSSEEESEEEDPDPSRSQLPVQDEVQYFENTLGRDPSEGFKDEASSSGSESDSDDSSDDESGVEEVDLERADTDAFLTGEDKGINYNNPLRNRKFLVIGLGAFCVVLLAIAIGLGVGLSQRKKNNNTDDDETEPAPAPTITAVSEPTFAPVRMPISLPNAPKLNAEPVLMPVLEEYRASQDTTIFWGGDAVDTTNGDEEVMLVQHGLSYGLVELLVDDSVQFILNDEERSANFCLEHIPDEEAETLSFAACLLGFNFDDLPSLTGADLDFVMMPDSCVNGAYVEFVVKPDDTKVCVDVTEIVFERLADIELSNQLIMMIDLLFEENGDKGLFVSSSTELKAPTLLITGNKNPDCTTIADIICTDSRFSTLCGLVTATGLDKMLNDNRALFTAFAPTDEALEDAVAKGLNVDDTELVKDLLEYHMVFRSELKSTDIDCSLETLPPLRMANGDITNIQCVLDAIFVVGSGNIGDELPRITEADIKTCNGVVHVLDEVILPDTIQLLDEKPIGGGGDAAACQSLDELLCSRDNLKELCSLVGVLAADPQSLALLSASEMTVFAPDDKVMGPFLEYFDLSDQGALFDLILYHSLPGVTLLSKDVACDTDVTMGNLATATTQCKTEGDKTEIYMVGGGNTEENLPMVTQPDILFCNGVVHILDNVMIKEAQSA